MNLALYGHPFSSYCQKALLALYEKGIPFEFRLLEFGDEKAVAHFAALWPLKRMPVLVDDGRTFAEASIIIEHLDLRAPDAPRLIPGDPSEALDVRFMDRVFDNYVMTPMQRIVFDFIRPEGNRDVGTVEAAKALLEQAYAWLDTRMQDREWASGGSFSLADCAAAPSLFFADWVHPIGSELPNLKAYRRRLLARPSMRRAVDEARPYRHLFPPGAPDRD